MRKFLCFLLGGCLMFACACSSGEEAQTSSALSSTAAVSYTHLDVYKRQFIALAGKRGKRNGGTARRQNSPEKPG